MQNLIYPAPPVPVPFPDPPIERIELDLGGGESALAWFGPAIGHGESGAPPLILFFHGNGENLETVRWSGTLDRLWALDTAWLAVEYPGYGGAPGRPSEESIAAAARAALSWAENRLPASPKIAVGWSLGAAVAAKLADERPDSVAGLVLLSPWTSLPAIARDHFPSWLVGLALRERWDSLAAVERLTLPVLVAHGALDDIIPVAHGRALADRLDQSEWLEVAEAGHNDLLGFQEVWVQIDAFVHQISRPDPVR